MPETPGLPLTQLNVTVNIKANSRIDIYSGRDSSTSFYIDDGAIGDDIINDFGSDDTIIVNRRLYDSNGDGLIGFGRDHRLDIDRVSPKRAGEDQLSIKSSGESIQELRYLGELDGQYAYAKASTHHNFLKHFGKGVEGKVGADKFDLSGGSVLLLDNAVGVVTGNDYVTGVKLGSQIVLTYELDLQYDDKGRLTVFSGGEDNPYIMVMSRQYMSLGYLRFENLDDNMNLKLSSTIVEGENTFYVYEFTLFDT